jgi:alpha-L-fucosidase
MEKIPGGEWFTGAGFGMFIHWDHASAQGIEIGWPLVGKSIVPGQEISEYPVTAEEYHSSATNFNPTKWDAEKVADMALASGATYVVFTSRHVGGYSMFHTNYSDYSIEHSPFKRDILGELISALRVRGLRIGVYYSLADWHHDDYPKFLDSDRPYPKEHFPEAGWPEYEGTPIQLDRHRRSSHEEWERFLIYVRGQISELLTNYGTIDLLWFDAGWERSEEEWDTQGIRKLIKSIQPNVIINERLVGAGDYFTPEQSMPREGTARTWEMCMTIGKHWAWTPDDQNRKSSRHALTTLIEVVSRGGNLLLNTGIRGDGSIEELDRIVFEDIGRWMEKHRESVLGVLPGYEIDFYGPVTTRPEAIYLHLIMQPEERVVVRGIPLDRVLTVTLLSTGEELDFGLTFEVHHRAKKGEARIGELAMVAPRATSTLIDVIKITLASQG